MNHPIMPSVDEMKDCLDKCLACYTQCVQAAAHGLRAGGRAAEVARGPLQDCAEACRTSAGFLARISAYHAITCRACSEICRLCAEECKSVEDDVMMDCSLACQECANACDRMTKV